jgi:hypothetical protein
VVVEVVKQTIWSHHHKVLPFDVYFVLCVESFDRGVTTCATLIGKVKTILLLFWPEAFFKFYPLMSVNCCENYIAWVSQIWCFHDIRFNEFSKHGCATTSKLIHCNSFY